MRCWYTRWQMSNALERGDLAARLDHGHAASCASCQAFGHALECAARSAVPRRPRAPRRRPRPYGARAGRGSSPRPLAAGAAVAIVIAIGTGGPAVDRPPPSVQASESFVQMRRAADQLSRALAKTPLETELDDLLYDGRRGLDAVLATGSLR